MKSIILFIFLATIPCFSLVGSYLQGSIAAYPVVKQAIEYFSIDQKLAHTYKDASPEIAAFIHELLEQHGVLNAKEITIKLGKEYCSGNNILMIEWLHEHSDFSLLESLIFQYNTLTNAQETEELLMLIYQQIGSIEHEIAHIKHHDCKKRVISLACFSLLTWTAAKLLEAYCPPLQKLATTPEWKVNCMYSIISGLLLSRINKHFFYKICRNQERTADAMISDNASILLAKVNLHTAIYEMDKQSVEKKYGIFVSWLCQKIPSLYLFFDWEHPTSYERAKTFTQRLLHVLNSEPHSKTTTEI